jgi:hypothetical protein
MVLGLLMLLLAWYSMLYRQMKRRARTNARPHAVTRVWIIGYR